MIQIILPKDEYKRSYILYLYKNRNNFHNMKNQDIDNLVKIMLGQQLESKDYPINENKNKRKIYGYSF